MVYIVGFVVVGVYFSFVFYCDVVIIIIYKILCGFCGGLIFCCDVEFVKKFDKVVFFGSQGGFLEYVIVVKVVVFGEVLQFLFKVYSQQVVVNVVVFVEQLIVCGIDVVSGGIDNYVVLLDLCGIGMIGKVVDLLVSDVYIMVNKNIVFFDFELFFVISGLWLGIVVFIICGFDVQVFWEVVDVIVDCFFNFEDDVICQCCFDWVVVFCECFFFYVDSKQFVLV